jgi:hypothetical protein
VFEIGLFSAVVFAAIWIVIGSIVAFLPRPYHPPFAFLLLVLLVPLIPYMWIAGNPFLAIMFVLGVGSIMRWPFYYIGRMGLRKIGVPIPLNEFEAANYQMKQEND